MALNDLPRTPVESRERTTSALGQALRARFAQVEQLLVDPDPTESQIASAITAAQRCAVALVATLDTHLHPAQARLVEGLRAAGSSPIVISLASPFDLRQFPEIDTYLCAYSWRAVLPSRGRLPVAIPGAITD